jgi:chitodextrinase
MSRRTRTFALTCASLLTATMMLVVPAAPAAAATNLVVNPGFETGSLSPWACGLGSVVTSPAHSGTHALAGAASSSDDAQCTQNIAVVSGSQYTLSAYVEGNYVYLGVTGGVSTWTPSAAGWTLLTTTFTASSSTAQIYLHGWYAQGTYHADDVSLTGPGGTVTVPSAPTGLAVTGTTSSTVALSWTGSSGATGYNVYQGATKVATVTGTTDTVTGLAASTSYTFSVTATNSAGESGHSGSVTATTASSTPTKPAAPTGLSVTGTTSSTVGLSWTSSSGATGYNVYQGATKVASVAGTTDTVSGLAASTSYTFSVTATNSAGESAHSASVSATTAASGGGGGGGIGSAKVWPYIDITAATPTLAQVAQATGQKDFTLAFVLGDSAGCEPAWGGTIALNDSRIAGEISALRALGGDVAVSFGGAEGPYLSSVCTTVASQAAAYERVIDAFNIKHIDFDVEASIPIDTMNKAIAQVQRDRPGTTVSYTLEVVADSYGIVDSIGVDVLTNAVSNGVNVGIVNPMTMDYSSSLEWGDSVIAAANATKAQMALIWPSKTSAQLYAMLGVTPMIGRNDTGPIFSIADAQKLVTWADGVHVGELAFWSVGRDNGGCPGGGVSPTCSSISQSTYQFTSIFGGYTG